MTAIPVWRAQRERGSRVLMQVIVTLTLKVGRPVGRLTTPMSFQLIPIRKPVPSALEQASLAAQRLA